MYLIHTFLQGGGGFALRGRERCLSSEVNGLGCSYFCLLIRVRSVSDFIIKEIVVMNFNYFLLFVFLNVESSAQLILSTSPSFTGIPSSVFEQLTPGGPVTRVNSGFGEMNFASISRDGGSILFSASDPVDPVLLIPPSSDLYRFDRATGQTLRLLDQESIIVPNPVARQSAVFTPEFNALSPDGSEVAFTNRVTLLDGNTNPERGRNLSIVRADGSQEGGVIERGRGQILDDFDSEFVGMSWAPDSQSFATSGYIPTFDPLRGAFTELVGIVRFPGVETPLSVLRLCRFLESQALELLVLNLDSRFYPPSLLQVMLLPISISFFLPRFSMLL